MMEADEADDAVENFDMVNTLKQLRNRQIELSRKELYSEEHLEPFDDTAFSAVRESEKDEIGRYESVSLQKPRKSLSEGTRHHVEFEDKPSFEEQFDDVQKFGSYNSKRNLFFPEEHADHQNLPEWFVDCSRSEAEELLLRSDKSGNVLMRKSSSFATNGNYVITLRRDQNSTPTISHYSVIKCKGGFKIDVQNQHSAMHSLPEVMTFFVSVVGQGTRPFSSRGASSY